jgi:hypothetical protein
MICSANDLRHSALRLVVGGEEAEVEVGAGRGAGVAVGVGVGDGGDHIGGDRFGDGDVEGGAGVAWVGNGAGGDGG